jgi:hypothetical protein
MGCKISKTLREEIEMDDLSTNFMIFMLCVMIPVGLVGILLAVIYFYLNRKPGSNPIIYVGAFLGIATIFTVCSCIGMPFMSGLVEGLLGK